MRRLLLSLVLASCGAATPPSAIPLPGAGSDGVSLDYIAYDAVHDRVWVPAGGTGKIDVVDAASAKLHTIDGLPTKQVERHGKLRTVGPSSAAVGEGVVYVGSRGDSSVCSFDAATLARGKCQTLGGMPDNVVYVAATHQVWVTVPHDKQIVVLDAATLAPVAGFSVPGEPEGFAVDGGTVFTNLEDADKTLAIDAATRETAKTWDSHCGEEGPKGLAFDAANGHLVVACHDKLEALDARGDGHVLGTVAVGAGVDAVDFSADRRIVVAASAGAATVSVVVLAPDGGLKLLGAAATVKGARNAVVARDGSVFVGVGPAGEVLVVRGLVR